MTLLAPAGLLLALGVLPILAALLAGERRAGRARTRLRLRAPSRAWTVVSIAAVSAAGALLALAASRPVVNESHARFLRTDAEAFFVIDTSRSMLAANSATGLDRLDRAKQAAETLRKAIPDVPAGVASFTDRLLPNLFPTSDPTAFAATVDRAVGIDRPPPGGDALTVTTFDALAAVTKDAYFIPGRKRLLLVVLTDAESADFDVQRLRDTLAARGIRTVLVQVGSAHERVFGREGLPEADYRPEPTAQLVKRFVAATGAHAFGEHDLAAAAARLRADAGNGARVRLGTETDSTDVAPYLVLAAFFPLGLLLFRRNVL
jgi:VWA domain-containing protein